MYGGAGPGFPRRIVCLSAATTEIAFAVGAGDRVVGVPDTATRPPAARARPRVEASPAFHTDGILALRPDLVLASSERDVVGSSDRAGGLLAELIGAGASVLCTNPRSLEDVQSAILLIGGVLGCAEVARDLVRDLRDEIGQVREYSRGWPRRPRVYFEEWPDPMIAGIRWVSELVETAGGHDVFADRRNARAASARVVSGEAVVALDPEIILAAWCGRRVDGAAIARRPGWERVAAVRDGQIHELDGADVLVPGPSLVRGLRRIHEIVQAFLAAR